MAASHARTNHSLRDVPRDLEKMIVSKYPLLVSESIQPEAICPAIFGLAIPLDPFLICTRCRRGYTNVQSWSSHVCRNAQTDTGGQPPYYASLVQTFFLGKNTCYFPIHTPPVSPLQVGDFSLFKAQLSEHESAVETVIENENYREVNQFLQKEGWIAHIAGCTVSKLLDLVSPAGVDDSMMAIVANLRTLLSNIQDIISKGVFHIRRLLGRRPS